MDFDRDFCATIGVDSLRCGECEEALYGHEHVSWVQWGRTLLHGRCFERYALRLNPLTNIWCQLLVRFRELRDSYRALRLKSRVAAAALAETERARARKEQRSELSFIERAFEPNFDR